MGKFLNQFNKYLDKRFKIEGYHLYFNKFDFSLQYGVWLDYFEKIGVKIEVIKDLNQNRWNFYINDRFISSDTPNRIEAQKIAVKGAKEFAIQNYNNGIIKYK